MRSTCTIMVALAAAAILMNTASAGKRDFPAFDSTHAHCAIETTYLKQSCADIFGNFYSTIYDFSPEARSGGYYRIKEVLDNDYIWCSRTSPDQELIDDVIFVFVQQHVEDGFQCMVQARSRSQNTPYFDHDTNYCNMWTVLRAVPAF